MEFTKNQLVAFTTSGFRLEGKVVRQRKDGTVTVDAPVVMRRLNQPPVMDPDETMYWDLQPAHLTKI